MVAFRGRRRGVYIEKGRICAGKFEHGGEGLRGDSRPSIWRISTAVMALEAFTRIADLSSSRTFFWAFSKPR